MPPNSPMPASVGALQAMRVQRLCVPHQPTHPLFQNQHTYAHLNLANVPQGILLSRNLLSGTIPQGWQLPSVLQVRLLCRSARHGCQAAAAVHAVGGAMLDFRHFGAMYQLCQWPGRKVWVGGRRRASDHSLNTARPPLSAATQALGLFSNRLSGTIPEGWQLPDSLQVRRT